MRQPRVIQMKILGSPLRSSTLASAKASLDEKREVLGSIYGQPKVEPDEKIFRNVDGERHEDGRYAAFRSEALALGAVREENVFEDPVRTFAYGTDASFYLLIPKMVLKVETEEQVKKL